MLSEAKHLVFKLHLPRYKVEILRFAQNDNTRIFIFAVLMVMTIYKIYFGQEITQEC